MTISHLFIVLSCLTTAVVADLVVSECQSQPCLNGGTCNERPNGYTCTCLPGFTGRRCRRNVNECQSQPCLNGGTCNERPNGYTCTCLPGFTGRRCRRDINECRSQPCLNGGTCNDLLNGYTCTCLPGFTGRRCRRIDRVDCGEIETCLNGGTCVEGTDGDSCACPPGFAGNFCQDKLTSVECGSSGMIVTLDHRLVPDTTDAVHFQDISCQVEASSSDGVITLSTDYDKCDTTVEEDASTLTYNNTVTYDTSPGSNSDGIITRTYHKQFVVQCCLNKEQILSSFVPHPGEVAFHRKDTDSSSLER